MTFYFNVLNVLACIAVVMLHCNSCYWNGPVAGKSVWISANFIETTMYWAVPIFYMLTGAKLMDYRKRIYALAIFGWVLHWGGTIIVSSPETGVATTFKGYANVPSYLFAVGVFVFFKYRDYSKVPCHAFINKLSQLTFGVYLMHIYFIWEIPNILGISNYSIIWRTLGAIFVFAICSIITYGIQKIPVLNKILLP